MQESVASYLMRNSARTGQLIGEGFARAQEREDMLNKWQQDQANFERQREFAEMVNAQNQQADLRQLSMTPGVAQTSAIPPMQGPTQAGPPIAPPIQLPGTNLSYDPYRATQQTIEQARALETFKQQAAMDLLRQKIAAAKEFGGNGQAEPVTDTAGKTVGFNYMDFDSGLPKFHPTPAPTLIPFSMGQQGVTWANPKDPSQMTTVPLPEGSTPLPKIAGQGGGTVDPDALRGAVEIYRKTGQVPPFGLSANNPMRNAFFAEIGGEGSNIVDQAQENKAVRAGMSKAYATQQNLYQAEKTALGTLDRQLTLAEQYSMKVGRTGSPLANDYILYAKGQIAGDEDTKALENLVITAAYEFSKILSGASASIAGVTISSAEDAKNLLDASLSNGQFQKITELMRQESKFRLQAREQAINELKQGLGTIGNTPPASGTKFTPGQRLRQNGQVFVVDQNGVPQPAQ